LIVSRSSVVELGQLVQRQAGGGRLQLGSQAHSLRLGEPDPGAAARGAGGFDEAGEGLGSCPTATRRRDDRLECDAQTVAGDGGGDAPVDLLPFLVAAARSGEEVTEQGGEHLQRRGLVLPEFGAYPGVGAAEHPDQGFAAEDRDTDVGADARRRGGGEVARARVGPGVRDRRGQPPVHHTEAVGVEQRCGGARPGAEAGAAVVDSPEDLLVAREFRYPGDVHPQVVAGKCEHTFDVPSVLVPPVHGRGRPLDEIAPEHETSEFRDRMRSTHYSLHHLWLGMSRVRTGC
jgi:hypothetical protein